MLVYRRVGGFFNMKNKVHPENFSMEPQDIFRFQPFVFGGVSPKRRRWSLFDERKSLLKRVVDPWDEVHVPKIGVVLFLNITVKRWKKWWWYFPPCSPVFVIRGTMVPHEMNHVKLCWKGPMFDRLSVQIWRKPWQKGSLWTNQEKMEKCSNVPLFFFKGRWLI